MKLTVAVTTHNRPLDVWNALYSVCSQEADSYEVILVDDASYGGLPSGLRDGFADYPVSFFTHDENKGLAFSRNTAIDHASGEYFAFCDDDDQWPSGFAARLIEVMESAPKNVGMAIALNKNKKKSSGHLFEGYPRLSELMKAGLTPPVGSQIYRTDLLRQVGGYRPHVTSGVDHDLWISLARIDPRVAVAWGDPVIVGDSPSRERMTSMEHRRRAGVRKSLGIWRDDLCEVFGENFYEHFSRSYEWYLDYSFFSKSLKKGQVLDAVKRAIRSPRLPFDVAKKNLGKLIGRHCCTAFPDYKGD